MAQKHTKIYMKHFGHGEQDFIGCEVDGTKAVDIHHLDGRGPGKDVIENLMALCRSCHEKAHGSRLYNEQLKQIHLKYIS